MNYVYVNATGADVSMYHRIIVEAIEAGGVFDEDFADIFVLTRLPPGSAAAFALNWF